MSHWATLIMALATALGLTPHSSTNPVPFASTAGWKMLCDNRMYPQAVVVKKKDGSDPDARYRDKTSSSFLGISKRRISDLLLLENGSDSGTGLRDNR